MEQAATSAWTAGAPLIGERVHHYALDTVPANCADRAAGAARRVASSCICEFGMTVR
jgi:hypothetical protein